MALFLYKEGGGPGTKSDQHKFMDTIGFGELLVVSERVFAHSI